MSGPVAVGVDVGGTSAKLGVVEGERVLARGSVETAGIDPASLSRAIAREARRLVGTCPGPPVVSAVGVGCAGLIDTATGVVRVSPNLPGWRDEPLRDLLSRAVGAPVSLINDANAFGYAESRFGSGKGTRVGIYVTLGTGVGGVLMTDGGVFGGAHGMAGELGHMMVDAGGAMCLCGGRGCLETLVGSARIVALAERKIASGAPGAAIRKAAGESGGDITPKAIATAARAGDFTARAVFAEVGDVLGRAMASAGNLFDPEVIVVGGGVSRAGESLWTPMRDAFASQSIAPEDIRAALEPARLGEDAGLIGAATFARDTA